MTPGTSSSILVGKAYRAVYKGARVALNDLNLPPAQFILLAALWENDGQSGAQLGSLLRLDSATMTGLIDRAQAKDYVERRADPADRRINRIWLTQGGWALETPVSAAMKRFDDDLAKLVEGDVSSFNQSLARIGEML